MTRLAFSILVLLLYIFPGCDNSEKNNLGSDSSKNFPPINKSINTQIFRGMLSQSVNEIFTECTSHKKYIVSEKSEFQQIETVYPSFKKGAVKNFYIEAEGFSSVHENSKSKGFDTVLVLV